MLTLSSEVFQIMRPAANTSRRSSTPRSTPTNVSTTNASFAAIETAHRRGLITGSAGLFRPSATVTRAELASFVVNAARWPAATPGWASFSDVPGAYWAAAKIETAHGYCKSVEQRSYTTQRFEPAAAATRAEAAAAMVRMTTCLTGDEIR